MSVELPQLPRPSNHHYFHRLKPKSHVPTVVHILQARYPLKPSLFFIHHPLLFQSTKKISDNPIKFPSSPSSNEDDLLAHQSSEEDVSSDHWMPFDYSPPWSSEKEDPEVDEDKDDADAEDNDSDSDSDFASPPPRRARRARGLYV